MSVKMRKAFVFRGGEKIKPHDNPLKYLDSSIAKLTNTLREYGEWEVEDFVLSGSDDVALRLRDIEDSETNEILIFYTGHGVPQPDNRYALIGENSNEILFDNIINPINKFTQTRFILIIDACHSSEVEKSIPRVDNIEIVTSVTKGLAYEDGLFESSTFVYYFIQAITQSSKEIGSKIDLEYICQSINANNETLQKPIRIPPKHTRFTHPIVIAPSHKPTHDRPLPNAPIELPNGQVPMESIFYIAREDYKAYQTLYDNYSLIRIKAPRQYGKTSLLSRLIKVAREKEYQVVALNFQKLDSKQLNVLEKLLYYICRVISKKLHINSTTDWEEDKEFYAITEVASEYIGSILAQIKTPLVLAIDEADKLFEYNISNDFFGLVRAWHEESKVDENWNKLKIILSYSTEPLLGVTNINQSPFHNVGLGMELKPFDREQITYLANEAYRLDLSHHDLEKLQKHIGGHPYLTRKVLYEMANENIDLIEALRAGRFEEHLRRYKMIFEQNPKLVETIKTIIKGDCPNTELCYILEATGFIKSAMMNHPTFSSTLYQEFFENNF